MTFFFREQGASTEILLRCNQGDYKAKQDYKTAKQKRKRAELQNGVHKKN